ncbi:MAG: 16S rRNA (cytidine(1402)-2'-O)-methyltransferase [Bacilli bacterium]
MSQKSYDNSATLYLIPTPIGNMDDITFRTLKILEKVDVLLSEDTRVTIELLNHFDIKKKLISSHEYNETKNFNIVLDYLNNGKDVGIVSDRGTPVISDPGYEMASYVISKGYNVVALPGATALIPALITSGLSPMPFTFYGFLNNKESKRKKELENLKTVKTTLIFYESPHRIIDCLKNMLEIFGNRKISISREITKKYEEIYRGTIQEIIFQVSDAKGEFVIVVEGNLKVDIKYNEIDVKEHLNFYLNQGYELKEAMKEVAKERKISKSDVYHDYHN